MIRNLARLMLAVSLTVTASSLAYAQGGTTSPLTGTVVDSDGGVIPGATVTVKNSTNGVSTTVVTNANGGFVVAALEPGAYSVTVSLAGFKTAVFNDVRLAVGTPTNLKVTLAVGNLTETVEVKGGGDIVNTQTATVSSTLNVDQLNKMPMPTRNALNAVTFLPGVNGGHQPRLELQRAARLVRGDQPRRRQQQQQLQQVERGPVRDGDAPAGCGQGRRSRHAGSADIGGHGAVNIAFVTRQAPTVSRAARMNTTATGT